MTETYADGTSTYGGAAMSEVEWYADTDEVREHCALCAKRAVGFYSHPVLGNVATCQRCADKLGVEPCQSLTP
jgi:hypothetical protein